MELLDGERDFVEAVRHRSDDDETRLIYADWLEEQGDHDRAEWLRIEIDLRRMQRRATREDEFLHDIDLLRTALRTASENVDDEWLRDLSRSPVENCREGDRWPSFRFVCDKQWGDLRTTKSHNIRHCDQCRRNVYYCRTDDDARFHASLGHCIANAISVHRGSSEYSMNTSILAFRRLLSDSDDPTE